MYCLPFYRCTIGVDHQKGGYGVPVLVAIMFFMAFILLSISGEKFNRASVLNPIINAWLPVLILLPLSIYVTIKALNDSKIANIGSN
ncbi:MAG: LptF/LptG family permease [Saprospiraceae bacterium]|nr:LptF/LptG family permease [Saprospiraceae bacterium]